MQRVELIPKSQRGNPNTTNTIKSTSLQEPVPGLLIEKDVDAREAEFDRVWDEVEKQYFEVGVSNRLDVERLEMHRRSMKGVSKYFRTFDIPLRTPDESPRAYLKRLNALEMMERQALKRVIKSREIPMILQEVKHTWGTKVAAKLDGTECDEKDIHRAVWRTLDESFWAKNPSPDTAIRYQKAFDQLMEIIPNVDLPKHLGPLDLAKITCEQYCDDIEFSIRTCEVAPQWANKIAQTTSTKDRERLQKDFWQMKQDVKASFEPYGPQESDPRDSDLSKLPFHEGIAGNWRWRDVIGQGGGGYVNIWTRIDDEGNVLERMAVKEIVLEDGQDQWNFEFFWEGDIAQRVPREYAIPEYLTRYPDSTNIVKPVAYGIYPQLRVVRLYTEYCNMGDWKSFVSLYRDHNTGHRKRGPDAFVPIPAHALWSLFDDLASALCIMHQGYLPGKTARPADHRSVLHRDIKPGNIFRSTHKSQDWPEIPTSKFGDFGLSIWLDHPDAQNSKVGTRGWYPPSTEWKIDEKSNVWGIGRVMRFAMLQEGSHTIFDGYDESSLKFEPGPSHNGARINPEEAIRVYPRELCLLVERCLEVYPRDRIGVVELWEAIQKEVNTAKGQGQSRKTMKTSGLVDGEWWPEQYDSFLDIEKERNYEEEEERERAWQREYLDGKEEI